MIIEPMRDIIGRAIYEQGDEDWYLLSEDKREPWREDADRVISALWNYFNTLIRDEYDAK